MKVHYDGVTIQITDPPNLPQLLALDQKGNKDGEVTAEDFDGKTPKERNENMLRALGLTHFFAKGVKSGLPGQEKIRPELIAEFERIEAKVKRLHKLITGWDEKNIDWWGGELEFRAAHYQEVVDVIAGEGEFNEADFNQLAKDIYTLAYQLSFPGSGRPLDSDYFATNWVSCNKVFGFRYDSSHIPDEIRERFELVLNLYAQSNEWLTHYREIECEDWYLLFWGDCPKIDYEYIGTLYRLFEFRRDSRHLFPTDFPILSPYGCGGGGCFPREAFLQLKAGGLITFDELVALEDQGQELPEIASFNEDTGEIVYQRPTRLIRHIEHPTRMMILGLKNLLGKETTLKVTEEHRILVEKKGELEWVAVKDLKDGDILLSEDGEVLEYSRQATKIEEGAFNVYNFSFSQNEVEAEIPNYLVSTDGEHWVIAHNLK